MIDFLLIWRSKIGCIRNKRQKIPSKHILVYLLLALGFVASIIFVKNNYSFYNQPIAEVKKSEITSSTEVLDIFDYKDQLFTQQIIAELKNGDKKGQVIRLTNEFSTSKSYDQEIHVGQMYLLKHRERNIRIKITAHF